MIMLLYSLVIILSVLIFVLIFKRLGKPGLCVIISYLIFLIPDRIIIQKLKELYLNFVIEKGVSLGVWLEVGITLKILFSLVLSFVGFLLLKSNRAQQMEEAAEGRRANDS
jgi:hypothetical protein